MLNKLTLTLVCAVLFMFASPVAAQHRRERFDPDGTFWIVGQPPDGFSDFSGINLNAKRSRRLNTAGVDERDGRHFSYKTLVVRREKFVFTTVTVRGASYSFTGRFLRGGVFQEAVLDDEKPVLEGTLQKFVAGKKVAEAQLKFSYFGGT